MIAAMRRRDVMFVIGSERVDIYRRHE